MKRYVSPQKIIFLCSAIITITCWNGSMVDSSGKDKRPDVNFYGKLEDHMTTCEVEDILIGGKYEQIAFYLPIHGAKTDLEKNKDDKPQIEPRQNKVLLDLSEISAISMVHPDRPTEHELEINSRKYVEVEVTTITGSKQHYIIESAREISCLKIDKGPKQDQKPIQEKRKLNMLHVKNLWITGYKTGQNALKSDPHNTAISEKTKIAEGTEQILDQMEKKVNNLSKEDSSNYQQLKESLLSMLRALRDQLQKMLNLIKN